MLTTQDWLDAGYRRWDGSRLNNADFLLQKRFDDAQGKKYYLDVWVYEWYKYASFHNHPGANKVGFQPEVQFQRQEDMTLNVTFLMNQDSTIQDVEQQAEKLWVFLGKPYYEKWSE